MSDNAAAARPKRHRTITIDENAGPPRATARVCEAASCISGNASDITARLRELTEDKDDVVIKRVGCLGLCAAGPLVEIAETGEMFEHVSPDDVGRSMAALGQVTPGRRSGSRRAPSSRSRSGWPPRTSARSTPRASTTTSPPVVSRPCAASSPR